MRVLLTAIHCGKGARAANLAGHLAALKRARDAGCELAVFPEMSLTGYINPADPSQPAATTADDSVLALVAATRTFGVAALFGIAESVQPDAGPRITQLLAVDGVLAGRYSKMHLAPDERAAFVAGEAPWQTATPLGRFGVAICADMDVNTAWVAARTGGAQVLFHCAAPGLYGPRRASPADWQTGFDWWRGHCMALDGAHARNNNLIVAISTQAGATVDEDFPGWAAVLDTSGRVSAQLPDWRPGELVVDLPIGAR